MYAAAHRHPLNRGLHLAAKVAALAVLVVAFTSRSVLALALVPIAAVVPCWLGHALVEGNRPTAWSAPAASLLGSLAAAIGARPRGDAARPARPYYSLLADAVMCAGMVHAAARRCAGRGRPT